MTTIKHEPVLIGEVLSLISEYAPAELRVLDGTLGLGGYSEAVLRSFPESFVLGLDRDRQAIELAEDRLSKFVGALRFRAIHGNFGELGELLGGQDDRGHTNTGRTPTEGHEDIPCHDNSTIFTPDSHATHNSNDTRIGHTTPAGHNDTSARGHLASHDGNTATYHDSHASIGHTAHEGREHPSAFNVFMFDLGVSNMQISLPERGFSFNSDGLLDMRMDTSANTPAASDILRLSDEKTLAKIFYTYGEERYSRQIASAIKHSHSPIRTTADLVKLIRNTLPQPVQRKMRTHPARRVFQALRIYVNHETEELENLLASLPKIAGSSSLIIFVSYHSLEDRMIKLAFRRWQSKGRGKILTRHPIVPSEEEVAENYKARSAKLRAFCISAD